MALDGKRLGGLTRRLSYNTGSRNWITGSWLEETFYSRRDVDVRQDRPGSRREGRLVAKSWIFMSPGTTVRSGAEERRF